MGELFSNLGINGKLLFAQIVNFLIVFWVLQRFVFRKLLTFLEERKKRIEKGIEFTEQAQKEITRIAQARKREIDSAKQQAEVLMREAKTVAQDKAREMLFSAKGEEEKILLQAKEDAQKKKEEVLKEAKEEIRESAFLVAEKILERSFSEKEEERLAREVVSQFKMQPHAK